MALRFGVWVMILVLGMVGCNKEEADPLRIEDGDGVTDYVWSVYYPNDNKGCITICGGERPYSVSCESDILKVNIERWPNAFNYEVLGVGETEVKITDATGEVIVLKVKIDYRSQDIRLIKLDVSVVGDQMTVAAQKELKEKALATIPVKVGGGYKFIYTENLSGIVQVYPDQFGGEYKEGTFVYSYLEMDSTTSYPIFKIKLDGQEREFVVQRYDPTDTRSLQRVPVCLCEDLLPRFQNEYPGVEKVYTMQVFGGPYIE